METDYNCEIVVFSPFWFHSLTCVQLCGTMFVRGATHHGSIRLHKCACCLHLYTNACPGNGHDRSVVRTLEIDLF